jgi:hypothetical protein
MIRPARAKLDKAQSSTSAGQGNAMSVCACPRCNREATMLRRLPTSVGTLGRPEPVCEVHAAEADDLAEHLARLAFSVDRVVRQYKVAA